jgi:hypothetical protein
MEQRGKTMTTSNLIEDKILTAQAFLRYQLLLGWTNAQAGVFFGKSSQTVSNWRAGAQKSPKHVVQMLNGLIEKYGDLPTAGNSLRDELQAEVEKFNLRT